METEYIVRRIKNDPDFDMQHTTISISSPRGVFFFPRDQDQFTVPLCIAQELCSRVVDGRRFFEVVGDVQIAKMSR